MTRYRDALRPGPIDHDRELDARAEEEWLPAPVLAAGKRTRTQALATPALIQARHEASFDFGRLLGQVTARAGIATGAGQEGQPASPDALIARAQESPGERLPQALQARFEGAIGADLSAVRVHTGPESAEAARSIGARAYALGRSIHMAPGQYDPDSVTGQHLLAHEVAHTIQQGGGAVQPQGKLAISQPGDTLEVEADHAADAMVAGTPARVSGGAPASLSRAPAGVIMRQPTAEGRPAPGASPAGTPAGHPGPGTRTISVKRPVHIGDVKFELELKADLRIKGSGGAHQDLLVDDVTVLEGKLDMIGHKVGFAFLEGKESVDMFPGVTFQLVGSAGESTLDGKGTNLKLGTIGIAFKGEASELLRQGGLAHLDGKVAVHVTGSLTWTALDARDAVVEMAEHHLKARRHAETIAEQAADLGDARDLHTDLERQRKDVQQRIHDLRRSADELDHLEREERLRLRREVLDQELELKRQRRQLDDALRASKGRVERITAGIADETQALDETRHKLQRLARSAKSKAGRAMARGMAAMSKKIIGRLLLKAIPIVGWALAILDGIEIARFALKALRALWRGDWGEPGSGGGGKEGDGGGGKNAGSDADSSGAEGDGAEGGETASGDGGDAAGPDGRRSPTGGGNRPAPDGEATAGNSQQGGGSGTSLLPGDAQKQWPEERATIPADEATGQPGGDRAGRRRAGGAGSGRGAGRAGQRDGSGAKPTGDRSGAGGGGEALSRGQYYALRESADQDVLVRLAGGKLTAAPPAVLARWMAQKQLRSSWRRSGHTATLTGVTVTPAGATRIAGKKAYRYTITLTFELRGPDGKVTRLTEDHDGALRPPGDHYVGGAVNDLRDAVAAAIKEGRDQVSVGWADFRIASVKPEEGTVTIVVLTAHQAGRHLVTASGQSKPVVKDAQFEMPLPAIEGAE